MLCTVYTVANKVNALLKSRVRENRKHGSVGAVMVTKLFINKIKE